MPQLVVLLADALRRGQQMQSDAVDVDRANSVLERCFGEDPFRLPAAESLNFTPRADASHAFLHLLGE